MLSVFCERGVCINKMWMGSFFCFVFFKLGTEQSNMGLSFIPTTVVYFQHSVREQSRRH